MRRLAARNEEQPTVRARTRCVYPYVLGEHGHQLIGEIHNALGPILRCADLDLTAVGPLNLSQAVASMIEVEVNGFAVDLTHGINKSRMQRA